MACGAVSQVRAVLVVAVVVVVVAGDYYVRRHTGFNFINMS